MIVGCFRCWRNGIESSIAMQPQGKGSQSSQRARHILGHFRGVASAEIPDMTLVAEFDDGSFCFNLVSITAERHPQKMGSMKDLFSLLRSSDILHQHV